MTDTASKSLAPTRAENIFLEIRQGSPFLFRVSAIFLILALASAAMSLADPRLIHGVSVWSKPTKFFVSLAVQFLTVSWALSLLPMRQREALGLRVASLAMAAAGTFEMGYIVFRAMRAEASHFNIGTPASFLLYSIMGLGALTITASGAYVGYRIWRERRGDLWREAAGLGLMLGALLGTLAGAYLSSQTGHWVGGVQIDQNGLGIFHWSTTGGDLRVAHFVGLHAAQLIPLAALGGRRWLVYLAGGVIAALTAATFLQALIGVPLLAS